MTEEANSSDIVKLENKSYQFGLYSGEWSQSRSKPQGWGKWTKSDVLRYEGNWDYGKWTGEGTVFDENGIRVCSGNYLNGNLHGFATYYEEDGVTIEKKCYTLFGEELPLSTTEEEFRALEEKAQRESEEKSRAKRQKTESTDQTPNLPSPSSSSKPKQAQPTVKSFSITLNAANPLMSAPLIGLFPRYSEVPVAMLEGATFADLEDEDIPIPTNLDPDYTPEDWLEWVRKYYPRKHDS